MIPEPEDLVDGRAFGADLVGNFDQHTGSFGPNGFYANFYDEKWGWMKKNMLFLSKMQSISKINIL